MLYVRTSAYVYFNAEAFQQVHYYYEPVVEVDIDFSERHDRSKVN